MDRRSSAERPRPRRSNHVSDCFVAADDAARAADLDKLKWCSECISQVRGEGEGEGGGEGGGLLPLKVHFYMIHLLTFQ